jgi:hypothetical protein
MTSKHISWRDVLPVHPAADMFPMMSKAELLELGKDIKKNGLQSPIIIWAADGSGAKPKVLDGRNRLDAMEAVGLKVVDQKNGHIQWNLKLVRFWDVWPGKRTFEGKEELQRCPSINDPYEYVISANIHRRHLTADQKRELIDKLLKADPTKSDRAIAKVVKADNKTVTKRRRKLEGREEIPHVKARTDTRGRKQPATKQKAAAKVEPKVTLYCSFCGKSQHDVRKLIAGPTVFICDECVGGCTDIINEGKPISATKVEPHKPIEPAAAKVADDVERHEVTAIEIERLASRLASKDRHVARELHRVLRDALDGKDGHGVLVLTCALARELGNDDAAPEPKAETTCGANPFVPPAPAAAADDDGLDLPASLRRTPQVAA